MRNRNFLQWHSENGGDVSRIDGYSHDEPKEPRQKNPDLKRHNYTFAKQIEVIDAEIVTFIKNN